jgi:hypothetical protein
VGRQGYNEKEIRKVKWVGRATTIKSFLRIFKAIHTIGKNRANKLTVKKEKIRKV